MRPPRAFAFDLDGTLVDSRLDIVAACNHVLRHAGRPPQSPEVIEGFVGDGVRKLVARAFGLADEAPELDALSDEFVRYYAAHPADRTTWMPGALATLDALSGRPIALVTNKARAVTLRVLDALGGRGRFAFVYAGGDGPLKPSPAPIVTVAGALGVEVPALWVIGDAAQDVRAARAAGAVAIAVLGGFATEGVLRGAGPDALLRSIDELPALVASAA
jgi:phosphoglycolate phosphatase